MANCKDCLYVEVCKDFAINYLKTNNNAPMESLEKEVGDYPCCRFQDRSLFVKLPCKVGDVIFCTTMGKIYQGIVGRIEIDDEGFAIITTDGYCFDSSICYHTQEEAEKVMNVKERENSV